MEGVDDERYKLSYKKLIGVLSETGEHDRVDEFWVKHVLWQMELRGMNAMELLLEAYNLRYKAQIMTLLSVFIDEIDEDLVIVDEDGLKMIYSKSRMNDLLDDSPYLEVLLQHSTERNYWGFLAIKVALHYINAYAYRRQREAYEGYVRNLKIVFKYCTIDFPRGLKPLLAR